MIIITPPKYCLVHYINETIVNETTRQVTHKNIFKVLNVSDSKDRCLEVMLNHRLDNMKEICDSDGNVLKRLYPRVNEYQIYKLDKIPSTYYNADIQDEDISFE